MEVVKALLKVMGVLKVLLSGSFWTEKPNCGESFTGPDLVWKHL